MKKLITILAVAIAFSSICMTQAQARVTRSGAKYVIYLIGDGMASPQIHATEAYLAALDEDDKIAGGIKAKKLFMSEMPVQGMQMSFANNRFITGSAAAGTALACGKKTNIDVISMSPDVSVSYKSLAEAAKEKGMKVGIVTSVSIDHATPAVFYSHTATRKNLHDICMQLANSNFDYFAGGAMVGDVKQTINNETGEITFYESALETAIANGFTYTDTKAAFEALTSADGKVYAVNPYLDGEGALPYAINTNELGDTINPMYENTITLAEFTQKGIDLMKDNDEGFFMMVEGGKIDWACHANDAAAAIQDTIAFDNAVKVALDFAAENPRDTLVVVTGDHECGGMTLGYAATSYETYYETLADQNIAFDDFDNYVLADYKASHSNTDIDQDMKDLINQYFGLVWANLNAYEVELLEGAFDKFMSGSSVNTTEEDNVLYNYYNPLSVTITHVMNRKAGMGWTSYSHTAVPVPVLAQGFEAYRFDGYYDNTDVALRIALAMKVSISE